MRLRGKQGFTPGIQRLNFIDGLLGCSQQGNAQQSRSFRCFQFSQILWSPCTCLAEESQWLALETHGRKRFTQPPFVIDLHTGQQVYFQEVMLSGHPVRPSPEVILFGRPSQGDASKFHAAWLTDRSDRVLTFVSSIGACATIAHLADVHSHSISPVTLAAPQQDGISCSFSVCSKEGLAIDILCWLRHPGLDLSESFEDQARVFNASSRQQMYYLSCPKQLHHSFLQHQILAMSQERPPFRAILQRLCTQSHTTAPGATQGAPCGHLGILSPAKPASAHR